ncbi:hypothetical protein [Arthrobacter sp. UNC362MFTsu5.1]|uniref:hypothetical protein n=1 Tax=Arthrobacter sp. UNC362MFTsu5.1 TaxID=1449044 RepID=UPI0012DCF6B6|nr:hypothetical protein [Arthrobacter sp. UNC362MFTsu5.1]
MIERAVNFERLRGMRCGSCKYEWQAHDEWLDRFHQADEACPECRTDCQVEERPDFWVVQDDSLYDDSKVRDVYWYHTSTHANWPDRTFDPTARLTDETKQRFQDIGTDGRSLERWAQGQKTKALHLGTYEAAIENMLRRMSDQDSADDQFYLYRVRLSPNAAIVPGVHKEPTDWVGDVQLAKVCAPGLNTFRYVNTHEDPSSVSLAVTPDAIQAVQGIPIPLAIDAAHPWISAATARLLEAASLPAPQPKTALERMRRTAPSALSDEARKLEAEVADTLPLGLRHRLHAHFDAASLTTNPGAFPMKLTGLAQLVRDPLAALDLLDAEPWRDV